MGGTKHGGKNARDTNLARYGKDFYKRIGSLGGKKFNPLRSKGFALMKANGETERISRAGRIGGSISRRNK